MLLLSVTHRLGFQQQPFVLDWQQAPPASVHSRVRSILITATGLGCLNLRAKLQVSACLACISCQCETTVLAMSGSDCLVFYGVPELLWTSDCGSHAVLLQILQVFHLLYSHVCAALVCHQATLVRQASYLHACTVKLAVDNTTPILTGWLGI